MKVKKILKFILLFLFFILLLFLSKDIFFKKTIKNTFEKNTESSLLSVFENAKKKNFEKNKYIFKKNIENLKKENCLDVKISKNIFCNLKNEISDNCFVKTENINLKPKCVKYENFYLKKPDNLKVLYYSAYAAASLKKINDLINFTKKTDVNAVIIDVKEIDGSLSFIVPTDNFKIKPKIVEIIKNPKDLIKKLHENGIYTIARVVVFKDKYLANKIPEFAVKRSDKKTIWKDYRKKTWLDANNKEVWDYIIEISRQSYLLGFDEINLDYVRFPSDGPMRDIYFPYSNIEIEKSKKWGRAKVMNDFYYYYTSNLKKEFPNIQLSADVFGQVALNWDDVSIGQILESAVLYFDGVYPMSYPSHYAWNFIPQFSDGPDNHPYEVINKTIKAGNLKIDRLNEKINIAIKEKKDLILRPGIVSKIKPENLKEIDKNKTKYWLQAFYCSWCRNSKPYGKNEVYLQQKALYDNENYNWLMWNAASRYKLDHYKK